MRRRARKPLPGDRRSEGELQAAESARGRVPSPGALADSPVVALKLPRIAAGVEPRGGVVQAGGRGQPQGRNCVHESRLKGKSFVIPKRLLWDAWLKVKEKGGAAGADGVTIEQFEEHLSGNLFRLWNRMSSGSYFPGPVRAVEIPKKGKKGGIRVLGIPTVTAYHEVAQASFGFAGGHPSVSSALRRAVGGVVRPPCWRRSYLCVRGRAAGERVAARGCDRSGA